MSLDVICPDCYEEANFLRKEVSIKQTFSEFVFLFECPKCGKFIEKDCGGIIKYVNAYAETRCFGGQEEGGWWYNCGEPLDSVSVTSYNEFVQWKKNLVVKFKDQEWGDIYSSTGGMRVKIVLEDKPAEAWPLKKPTYE
ncbi:MAG TPA: hypothetical protein VMX17_14095 [Candidatus Glassbacteria bacterium]|nr:hypothetical protein [Candidatus Glassbacteria bacterium]